MGSAILTLSSPFRMNLCFLTELIFALGALGPDRVLAKQIDVNLKVDVNQGGKLTWPEGQRIAENMKRFRHDLEYLYDIIEYYDDLPTLDVKDIIKELMETTNKINTYTKDTEKFNEEPGKVRREAQACCFELHGRGWP